MVFDYFGYVILPLLIFFARVVDVSLGTLRIIFISKGFRFLAPFLGFFEVLIWILAITKLVNQATNFIFYLAYAGGFAVGNLVGMIIERRLSLGKVMLRIISSKDLSILIQILKEANYPLTIFDGEGRRGKVKLLLLVINKKESRRIIEIVESFDPNAFYTLEDVRYTKESKKHLSTGIIPKFLKFHRSGK